MDGDRPMADGRDLLESRLQEFLRQEGIELQPWQRDFIAQYLRNRDRQTDHVGAQDEASEAREVGDRVRPESYLKGTHFETMFIDEITDEFAREMGLRFAYEGKKVAMGHSELTKMPDGSIRARIEFYPQNPR